MDTRKNGDPAGRSPIPEPDDAELRSLLGEHVLTDLDDAMIISDRRRRIRLVNAAFRELFGYAPEEVLGRTTRLLYADPWGYELAGQERVDEKLPGPHAGSVTAYKRSDGAVFDGESTVSPIHRSDGSLIGFSRIVRDVSARVAMEKVLSHLHRITSDTSLDFDGRLDAILDLGREHFRLPIGIVSEIEGETYRVVRSATVGDAIPHGAEFPLSDTYCAHALWAHDPIGFNHVATSDIRNHTCYRRFRLEAYLGTCILVEGKRYGTLSFSGPSPTRPFSRQDFELVRLFAIWIGHEISRMRSVGALSQAQEELRRLATTDPLTGLFNRRELRDRMATEIERARRYQTDLSLVMFDVDHFKRFNDEFGHDHGDRALCRVSDVLRETARTVDLVSRWGGEEFLVLLPNTDIEGAVRFAERVRQAIERAPLDDVDGSPALTVSAGSAAWELGEDAHAFVCRADAAMYTAKGMGRNCVCAKSD